MKEYSYAGPTVVPRTKPQKTHEEMAFKELELKAEAQRQRMLGNDPFAAAEQSGMEGGMGSNSDEETEAIYQTALDDAAIVVDTKLQEYSSATEFKAVIDTGFDNNELATYADSKSNELNAKVTEAVLYLHRLLHD